MHLTSWTGRFLRILQADGRATYDVIGAKIGLSPSAVLRRVKRLEASGVIDGYVAKGFFPEEDIGQLQITTEASEDISFSAMLALQDRVDQILDRQGLVRPRFVSPRPSANEPGEAGNSENLSAGGSR